VNLAARLVNDRALAEDLAQEAFTRAFARLASYDPQRRFAAWFLQIVRNVTIDHLRHKRPSTVSLDELEDAGYAGPPSQSADASPYRQAERGQLAAAVDRALQRLRPEYREAVVLHYQESLTSLEIAEILGLPTGTVKTHLHRARKELASMLSEAGWGPSQPGFETPVRDDS
jgi:RNA polymerase sigma-70 factor (ECF subfamily)